MISLWGKVENPHVFVEYGNKGSLCISCNFFQCIFSASLSAHRIALSYTFHRLRICWMQPITIIFIWIELLYQATPGTLRVDHWAACRLNTYSWRHGSSVSCAVMLSSVCRAGSKPIEHPYDKLWMWIVQYRVGCRRVKYHETFTEKMYRILGLAFLHM